jgi:hypothetical protein
MLKKAMDRVSKFCEKYFSFDLGMNQSYAYAPIPVRPTTKLPQKK